MRISVSLGFLMLICSLGHAQYNPTIRSARPGLTIGTFTVGKGVLQFQQGVDYSHSQTKEIDFATPDPSPGLKGKFQEESLTLQNIVRFGISEKFEFSTAVNYKWSKRTLNVTPDNNPDPLLRDGTSYAQDLQNIDVGFRYNILDGSNANGLAWGVQARTEVYRWFTEVNLDAPLLKIRTALGKALGPKFTMRLNLGYDFKPENAGRFAYGLNAGWSPIEKLSFCVEYSGFVSPSTITDQDIFHHTGLFGIFYLLHKDVQLDVRFAYTQQTPRNIAFYDTMFFTGAGISWRFTTFNL